MTQWINTGYCWKEHFSLSPENMMMSLEGKPFFLFVFITASYFLSGETQVVTSAEIPSLHISENQCPHGWETGNAPGGLWCPGQPVRYQSWRQEDFFVRGHSAEGNDLFPTQSAGLFALHQDSSRLTKLLKSAWRMSSPSDTGQAPNTLAIPLSVGPCCLCFAD